MNRRKGVALLMVLWISALLTLGLYSLLLVARIQTGHADHYAAEARTRQLAMSGVDAATSALEADEKIVDTLGDAWSKDDAKWKQVELGEGTYSLVRTAYEGTDVLYGVGDENGKINLNTAPPQVLQKLPGMTEDIAQCIVDWIDAEPSVPQEKGAETDYYMTLNPPYECKNKPFETLEELLYVKGVTQELFYGEDTNLNGVLDPNEDDGDKSLPTDNSDGTLGRGFYHFLTVWSYDLNKDKEGNKRLNLNKATRDQLQKLAINNQQVNSIEGFKRMGGQFASTGQLLDLPGWNRATLGKVMDFVTTTDEEKLPGVINIMTAPKEVLLALPGMDETKATGLIDWRAQEGLTIDSIGQAITNPALDENTIKQLAPFVTIRSRQFRIDATGLDGSKPVYKRFWGVYDRGATTPHLVYLKDITDRGLPFTPEEPAP